MDEYDPDLPAQQKVRQYRRPLMVAVLGNIIEYYDATLYGLLAVFLSKAFFSFDDANSALLVTYAIFVISYAIRPIAGLFLGRLADVRGHRFVLVLTINMMTIGTLGIGLIPNYAQIGFWAPLLVILCRLVQGIGASAEYTVATSYVLEQGPADRSNYLAGWSNAGSNLGPMVASVVTMVLVSVYGQSFLGSGGWRVLFLLSAPLGLLAFYLRRQMLNDGLLHSPSPDERRRAHIPLFTALRGQWTTMMTVIAMGAGQRIGTFCIQAYFVTALIRQGHSDLLAMFASILLYGIGVPASVAGGLLSDRIGGRRVLTGAFAVYACLAVPLFHLLGASVAIMLSILLVCAIINNMVAAPLNQVYIMSFPHAVRGAAAALNFNVGGALVGSTAPLVATWLVSRTGSETAFGWYMAALCIVSCLTAAFAYPKQLARRKNVMHQEETIP